MGTDNNFVSVVVAALVGALVATAVCVAFFFLFLREPSSVVAGPTPSSGPAPSSSRPPDPDVAASDVTAIELKTSYKGFFEDGRCAGQGSSCRAVIRIERSGAAKRTIFFSSSDDNAEKAVSTASLKPGEFDLIAKTVVSNGAFRAWREGMTLTTSNSSIRVEYNGGTKTIPSNVDQNTTTFLEMMNAIKQLNRTLAWKEDS